MGEKNKFRITENNFSRPITFFEDGIRKFKMHFYYCHALLLLLFYYSSASCLGKPSCLLHEFQCNNGKCIMGWHVCNLKNDCGDYSDESRTDGALCGMLNYLFKTMI